MNLRHAAALALVGWYLMVPPPTGDNNSIDIKAPLSKWQSIQSFDSANECESFGRDLRDDALAGKGAAKKKDLENESKRSGRAVLSESVYEVRILAQQCIASDDPRLKEK